MSDIIRREKYKREIYSIKNNWVFKLRKKKKKKKKNCLLFFEKFWLLNI